MGGGGANPDPATARIRFRRGDVAGRLDYTPENGEPLWDSNNNLYVGDGVTPGGVYVGRDASQLTQGTLATARGGTGVTTGLTALNAGNLNAGTVPDARLAATVARTGVAQTWTAAQTLPAIFSGFVMPLSKSVYASSASQNVTLATTDIWVQYWRPSASYTVDITLPPLSSVADGHMIFLLSIVGPGGTATLHGNGSENIDASDGGYANTATLSSDKFILYICRGDTASARWRLIKLN